MAAETITDERDAAVVRDVTRRVLEKLMKSSIPENHRAEQAYDMAGQIARAQISNISSQGVDEFAQRVAERVTKTTLQARTMKEGTSTFNLKKAGDVVTVSVNNSGDRVVGSGTGVTVNAAIENVFETTADDGLKRTITPVVFPEF
jgi:hypothetical protein